VKALIVVDVQNGVCEWEGEKVFASRRIVSAINGLIGRCREAGSPVIFVQHEDDELVPGSDAWALLSALDRREGDVLVSKRHGSAFHDTRLSELLQSQEIGDVVVCGMQTELCVDSTCRHAYTLGYRVELAADAHTTFDTAAISASQIIDHHNRTLRSYVSVVPAESVVFDGRTQG